MSTDTGTNDATQDGNTTSDSTSDAGDEFTPITSQADLDRIVGDRVKRERAKFGDYDDLRAKAARLDEIEEANKSELDRERDRAAKAEQAAADARAEALRLRVATEHGISAEDAELFLTGADEETLVTQAKRLADREADRKRSGTRSPNEGRTSDRQTTDDPKREFLRGLRSD